MQYAIEILQREHLNVRYDIRRLRQLSDEVQCDLVKDLPLREAELQKAIAHLQSANIAIMPCSCIHEVIFGKDVIVIDKQCGVHGSTAPVENKKL